MAEMMDAKLDQKHAANVYYSKTVSVGLQLPAYRSFLLFDQKTGGIPPPPPEFQEKSA